MLPLILCCNCYSKSYDNKKRKKLCNEKTPFCEAGDKAPHVADFSTTVSQAGVLFFQFSFNLNIFIHRYALQPVKIYVKIEKLHWHQA